MQLICPSVITADIDVRSSWVKILFHYLSLPSFASRMTSVCGGSMVSGSHAVMKFCFSRSFCIWSCNSSSSTLEHMQEEFFGKRLVMGSATSNIDRKLFSASVN